MRDIFLIVIVILLAIAALKKTQVGILGWVWLSVLNPNKLTFGWSYSFPLLDIMAMATLVSAAIHWKSRYQVLPHPVLKLLAIFYAWTTLTTFFAVDFNLSFSDWLDFTKTLLLVFLILMFMNTRHWTIALITVFILCIGYTGLKGGGFTVLTGGGSRVWGAPQTAWGDNNGVSMAMQLLIPLTVAFRHLFDNKWFKWGILGTATSFFFSLLGTQSRGGLVGLLGMSAFFIIRSKNKLSKILILTLFLGIAFVFMPQSWHDRMYSIQGVSDHSAQTRLIQWQYAMDIAAERPFFGNGFDAFYYKPYYYKHVAHLDENRAVHSNYFQVLGEQGYIGLFLYLVLGFSIVEVAYKYSKRALALSNMKWERVTLDFAQFSIVGFAFNGLTVNMAYLDLFYITLTFIMLLSSQIRAELDKVPCRTKTTQKYNFFTNRSKP